MAFEKLYLTSTIEIMPVRPDDKKSFFYEMLHTVRESALKKDKKFIEKMDKLLYTASLKPPFKKDIRNLRKEARIPIDGLKTLEDAAEWIGKAKWAEAFLSVNIDGFNRTSDFEEVLHNDILKSAHIFRTSREHIAELYNIPFVSNWMLMDYIAGDFKEKLCAPSSGLIGWQPASVTDKRDTNNKLAFKVMVYEGASKEDATSFIERNWSWIWKTLNECGEKNKKISIPKPQNNPDLNNYIWKCYAKKESGLKDEYITLTNGKNCDPYEYTEQLICRLIKLTFGLDVTEEMVKSIQYRNKVWLKTYGRRKKSQE